MLPQSSSAGAASVRVASHCVLLALLLCPNITCNLWQSIASRRTDLLRCVCHFGMCSPGVCESNHAHHTHFDVPATVEISKGTQVVEVVEADGNLPAAAAVGVRTDVKEHVGLLSPADFWRQVDAGRCGLTHGFCVGVCGVLRPSRVLFCFRKLVSPFQRFVLLPCQAVCDAGRGVGVISGERTLLPVR